jgi:hypothetical protein
MNGACLMTSNGRVFPAPERTKNRWQDPSLFVGWYIYVMKVGKGKNARGLLTTSDLGNNGKGGFCITPGRLNLVKGNRTKERDG